MFDALLRGESAVSRISLQSAVGSYQTIGAAVSGERWDELPRNQRVTSDRLSLYALAAANAAIHDSGLDFAAVDRRRVGVAIGTSLGGTISQEAAYAEILVRLLSSRLCTTGQLLKLRWRIC
jgi:3-oxoacyl-[acyl-carrier-protein] synthase II